MNRWRIVREKNGVSIPISRKEWIDYLNHDNSIVRFVETESYIKSGSHFHDDDPDKQSVWRHAENTGLLENLHFIIDDYTGVFINVYVLNSKSIKKAIQVAKYFNARVKEGNKNIGQKYLNEILDDESGPKLDW